MYKEYLQYRELDRLSSDASMLLTSFIEFYLFYVFEEKPDGINDNIILGGFGDDLKDLVSNKYRSLLPLQELESNDEKLQNEAKKVVVKLRELLFFFKNSNVHPQSFLFDLEWIIEDGSDLLKELVFKNKCLAGECTNSFNKLIDIRNNLANIELICQDITYGFRSIFHLPSEGNIVKSREYVVFIDNSVEKSTTLKIKNISDWNKLLKSVGRLYAQHSEPELLYCESGSWITIFELFSEINSSWVDLVSKVISIINGSFDIIKKAKEFFLRSSNDDIKSAADAIIKAATVNVDKEARRLAEELVEDVGYDGDDIEELKNSLALNIKPLILFIQSGNRVKQALFEYNTKKETLHLNEQIETDFLKLDTLREEIKNLDSGKIYERLLDEGMQ